jgi:Spy/CpxP family protein refolding chaperone
MKGYDFQESMKVCQTIRGLAATRVRVWVGVFLGACLLGGIAAAPAAAQDGRGPGEPQRGRGGMRGHSFMAPAPAPPPPLATAVRPHLGLQLGLGGRWWDESKTVKHLNLRPDQQQRMDVIFEANKPRLMTLYNNLQREETTLASLPSGDLQDETKVFAAIDRVSEARADLEKANVHLLLQIRQQLDPGQVDELDREIASAR